MNISPLAAGVPVQAVERFLMESLPVAAVAHSYHVDALRNPAIQADPVFQRFSLIELNELHHQIAAVGSLLRLQAGDPRAAESLAHNLAGFVQNRQAALRLVPQFSPLVRQNRALRNMMALTQRSNQQVAQNWPVISRTLAAAAAPAPGPLLVGRPL
ncbi:MAG: hypothetical protein ACOY93_18805 [Bacillota bacterium]